MTRPLRIGVLGASRIAELAIVEPAHALGHRLVVCAARDRSRAEAFAEKYGVERVADTYDDVISDPEIDIVYNPLANSLHAPWNIAALRAGKPVLTEKPFANNSVDAAEVRRVASDTNLTIVEGFHNLFHPATKRLRQLVSGGSLGELQRVDVVTDMPEPDPDDPRWSLEMGGGTLMDLGCYAIRALRLFGHDAGGDPTLVAARADERSPGVDEAYSAEFAYPGGAVGSMTGSMTAPDFHFELRVTGSRGNALLHNFIKASEDDRLTVTIDGDTTTEHLGTRSSYTYQLEAVAAHVLGRDTLPWGADDAVANMTVLDDVYRMAGLQPR